MCVCVCVMFWLLVSCRGCVASQVPSSGARSQFVGTQPNFPRTWTRLGQESARSGRLSGSVPQQSPGDSRRQESVHEHAVGMFELHLIGSSASWSSLPQPQRLLKQSIHGRLRPCTATSVNLNSLDSAAAEGGWDWRSQVRFDTKCRSGEGNYKLRSQRCFVGPRGPNHCLCLRVNFVALRLLWGMRARGGREREHVQLHMRQHLTSRTSAFGSSSKWLSPDLEFLRRPACGS